MLGALSLFIAAGFGLMATAPIYKTAFAPGMVSSADEMIVLRHVTGGEVAAVSVATGDVVAAGDVLLRFDDRGLRAQAQRFVARRGHLQLQATRLTALLDGTPFDPAPTPGLAASDLAAARGLFAAEKADLDSAEAAGAARLSEHDATQAALRAAEESILAEIAAYAAQVQMSEALAQKNYGTQRQVLSERAQRAEAERRLAEVRGQIEAGPSRRLQIVNEIAQQTATRRAKWALQRSQADGERADIAVQLRDVEAQLDGLVIRAPIAGRILETGALAAGDVIAAGGLAARIVPASAEQAPLLRADVRISPDDIGHIAVGDAATLTISTFDERAFGEIQARLTALSPSSLLDEKGAPYFSGVLELLPEPGAEATGAIPRSLAGETSLAERLAPGMLVQARFATDSDTMLGYLFEPILGGLDVAFTER